MKEQKHCRRCLPKGHFAATCKINFFCLRKGCGKEHHWLIHPHQAEQTRQGCSEKDKSNLSPPKETVLSPPITIPPVTKENNAAAVTAGKIENPRICFKVVPVRVWSPENNKEAIVYAVLDSGSDSTLCLESLVD